MGMVPFIWTRSPTGNQYDTNGLHARQILQIFYLPRSAFVDWKVAGGLVTGEQSLQSFQDILGNASVSNTGFVLSISSFSYHANVKALASLFFNMTCSRLLWTWQLATSSQPLCITTRHLMYVYPLS
jgi:hypothetical protein